MHAGETGDTDVMGKLQQCQICQDADAAEEQLSAGREQLSADALIGKHVRLNGLKRRRELNRLTGIVLSYLEGKNRFVVEVKGRTNEKMALKRENLVVLSWMPTA